jgi:hypothetical protein
VENRNREAGNGNREGSKNYQMQKKAEKRVDVA